MGLKLLVLMNPGACSGRAGRLQAEINAAFAAHGLEVDFVETQYQGHASELAATAGPGRYDGLVAAGGDGTLFEVVNGLYRLEPSQRPPLGLLPLGTGNAFARDLGLNPWDWEKAVDTIAAGHTRWIDTGQVKAAGERFYFINIIGLGFVVDAGRMAQRLKLLGKAAYTAGALVATLGLKVRPLRMQLDGEPLEQDNLFVEVSNSRYTGTNFLMAPAAELDDGLFDVTLVAKLPRLRLLRLFPTIYEGRHVEYEEVTTRKASRISIDSPTGLKLAPDGEVRGHTPVEIVCLKQDLEMFWPASS